VSTITRTVTVAAGVFGPGHLGELTRVVPFEMVDAVIDRHRVGQRRVRLLPTRVGVYFLLALGLFPQASYRGVWAKLTAGIGDHPSPCGKALRDLRRRVGVGPVRDLFTLLAGPVASPRTPGVRFGPYRTVSFDGCRSIKVPDTPANSAWLGKLNAAFGRTGYPVIQLMTLVETGTRALIGAAFGTPAEGEITWARRLLNHLDASMLVLMDRGFDGADFLAAVAATKAQLLVRVKNGRRLPVIGRLPDGSILTIIGRTRLRVITAHVALTCQDGTTYGDDYRLATTLTDSHAYPAEEIIRLYHQRWEHEITYLALRHTLLTGRVLRSGDPAGLQQELWALLSVYQALRIAVTDAISTTPGIDPDQASWQVAVDTAQDLVTGARNITDQTGDLTGDIGRAVLTNLIKPRRPRVCPRRVKSPLSRWNKHPPNRPHTTNRIAKITITANPTHQPNTLTTTADP